MRLLLWVLLLYIGYRIVSSLTRTRVKSHQSSPSRSDENATIIHKDPVCGIYVSEEEAIVGIHNGQRLYFCSNSCLDKYREKLDHTEN